jgi:hypothetical protein
MGEALLSRMCHARMDSPRGECQVDGTAAFRTSFPRIRASVIERDFEAASRQQYREQCSSEAGTDDVDGAGIDGFHGISRNTSARCSLKRNTSSKVL